MNKIDPTLNAILIVLYGIFIVECIKLGMMSGR